MSAEMTFERPAAPRSVTLMRRVSAGLRPRVPIAGPKKGIALGDPLRSFLLLFAPRLQQRLRPNFAAEGSARRAIDSESVLHRFQTFLGGSGVGSFGAVAT